MLTRLITPPAEEPVTLAEAKAHLRLEHDLDDAYVTQLIVAARQYVEKICWRALVSQTWELVLNEFPVSDYIELPKGELRSITSVTYVDANGATQTWDAANYEVDSVTIPGRIRLGYLLSWPSGSRTVWNAVTIRYVVGWANAAAVPAPIKQAVLLLVSQLYEHRTPEVLGTIVSPVAFSFSALLSPYRLARFY